MSIVVNGTIIPENVANVLNVNGTNITSVVCDGTTVWTQSLFSATWSGSSFALVNGYGLQTSGNLYRSNKNAGDPWGSVLSDGTFSGNSYTANVGFMVSGSNIAVVTQGVVGAWISFNVLTHAFSGTSYAEYSISKNSLVTSGGLLAFWAQSVDRTGSYISLT